jgi:hypothetical protein
MESSGTETSVTVPPPSFDSATASPAELQLYGIPPEPAADSPEYPKWKQMIEAPMYWAPAPEALVEVPPVSRRETESASPDSSEKTTEPSSSATTGSDSRWSGYMDWNGGGCSGICSPLYTHSTGYFIEPASNNTTSGCTEVASYTWAGIGGWHSNESTLAQDGTGQQAPHLGPNEAFYEVVHPNEAGGTIATTFHASPGYYFIADTQYTGNNKYSFYMYNYETHQPFHATATGALWGKTTEFIVERPREHNLYNFKSVTFQGFTNGKAFRQYPNERIDMQSGDFVKEQGFLNGAAPTNVTNNYEFNDVFHICTKATEKTEEEELEGAGKGGKLPQAVTEGGSEQTGTTVKLSGSVDPEGTYTTYHFEYGTEAENYSAATPENNAGEGSASVPVSAMVTGLQPGTTYHYRITANSAEGTAVGTDETVKTTGAPPPPPPTVTTEPAVEVRDESATLAATVNPNGADTHYYFEYGPNSTLFERSVPAPPGNDAGAGTSSVHEGVEAPGLLPSKTYYYRVVASNSTGTSYGAEKSFTTPTVWSVQATPNPHGTLESDKLGGVSCWSATACVAVGLYVETLGVAVPLVESWNGTTWEVEPAPAPAGATRSQFESVSCTSATACMAVGYYENGSSVELPLAEQWNGTTWAVTTVPNPEGDESPLLSVSCTSASACTTVGTTWASGISSALAERWNGKVWKVETTATISGTHGNVRFDGVSCAATKACVAVGQYDSNPPTDNEATLAEIWNGKTWTQQTMPNPGDRDSVNLASISCASTVACTAVGQLETAALSFNALIEHWNGTTWEIQSSPNPTGAPEEFGPPSWGLQAVSCFSGTACTAIGSYDYEPGVPGPLLGERWNGTLWELEEPANPTGVRSSNLLGVSCPAATSCTAAGYSETFFGNDDEPSVTLAERLLMPNAETEAASSVTATTAVLNGTVNPEGVEATYRFEYGTSTAYGTMVPIPNTNAGSGTSGIKASQALTALLPKTTYHFRLVAMSPIGTIEGGDQTFTTP